MSHGNPIFQDKVRVLVAQSCLTVCNPMNCSPPGSSVHGILQASILEQVAIPFSRGSSPLRDRTQVSCIAGRFFTFWNTREAWDEGYHLLSSGYRAGTVPNTLQINSFYPHNKPLGLLVSVSSFFFYSWGYWISERAGDLPKVTQLRAQWHTVAEMRVKPKPSSSFLQAICS